MTDPNNRLIGTPEVKRRFANASDTTLWRLRRDGILPEPVKVRGKNVWLSSDIDAVVLRLATPTASRSASTTVLTQEVPDGLIN